MIQIPDLRNSALTYLAASFRIEHENLADDGDDNWVATFHEQYGPGERFWVESSEATHFQGILFDTHSDEDSFVAEIELIRANEPTNFQLPDRSLNDRQVDGRQKTTLDHVLSLLDFFVGLDALTTIELFYNVPRSQLPAHGLISDFIGVRTMAGGEELAVTGAELSIRGFPGDSVSWSLSKGRPDIIYGKFTRRLDIEVTDEVLADAAYLAKSRLNRYILEQAGVFDGVAAT